jgi:predicted PurR-regulated permease PerM
MSRSTQLFLVRGYRTLLTLAALFLVFWYLGDLLAWIVVAWVLSLVGHPLMRGLDKIRYRRFRLGGSFRAVATIAVFYLSFGLFVLLLVPPMIHQASNLSKVNPEKLSLALSAWLDETTQWLEDFGLAEAAQKTQTDSVSRPMVAPPAVREQTLSVDLDSVLTQKGDTATRTHIALNIRWELPPLEAPAPPTLTVADTLSMRGGFSPLITLKKQIFSFFSPSRMVGLFGNIVGMVGNFSVALASITFMLFFFLREEDMFERAVLAFVPARKESETRTVISRIKRLLSRYFLGMALEIMGITLYVWAFLWLLGVPNALLLGFVAALLNTIPYLGPLIGAAFGAVLTITANIDADFATVTIPLLVKLGLVFWTMQMLDNYFLQPWIFSQSVMAHPMEIFLVIIVGAKFSGVLGMVLAVPAYTVLRVIAAEFLTNIKVVRELTDQMNRELEAKEHGNAPPPSQT